MSQHERPDDVPPGVLTEVGDRDELVALVNQVMPFGRFKGTRLIDLPEPYVVWFRNEGLPRGKLGERLAVLYEIKRNGLEPMLRRLIEADGDADVDVGGAGDTSRSD